MKYDWMDYSNIESIEQLNEALSDMQFEGKCCKSCKKEEEEETDKGASDEEKEEAHEDSQQKEHYEVVYAKPHFDNCFKHIIIFTNNNDRKENKTLNNIYEAIDNLKKHKCEIIPQLHVFVAAEVAMDDDDNLLSISDGDETYELTDESNMDTLVFSRLGVQGENQCEHIVKLLQDRGMLVLNPIKYSQIACNKYETAQLLKKGEIPQPNFALMTKDILYNKEECETALKEVYPEYDTKDPDKNKDLDFVVKILDGHGGTGVMLIDGKRLIAMLQMVFAIDKETQLLLQKKEEADGGDIRVHVLTMNDKQVIMAAMKRVKIGGDFRSNVSLGAQAEPIKLTKEQEQIALKTALISKMPWCAVDIMPLVKGSNPKLGDNVVLEINASPGTDGITDVIKFNFINILLSELNDNTTFKLQDKIAGYQETCAIDFGQGDVEMLAKLDTGNGTKATSVEVGEYTIKGEKITFSINGKEYTFKIKDYSNSLVGDVTEKRPIITVPQITLGLRKMDEVDLSIVKKRNKSTNVLFNRELLSQLGYVVSPSQTHILTPETEKLNIV